MFRESFMSIPSASTATFFTRNDEGGHSFVNKQPTTEEDIALCMEALEGCPVEAIGDDGDKE